LLAAGLHPRELLAALEIGQTLTSDEYSDRPAPAERGMMTKDFNPDQPRDSHGRWTTSGEDSDDGGSAPQAADTIIPAAAVLGTEAASEAVGATSLFGDVGAAAISGLEALGAGFSSAAALLGIIFIPTNRSLTTTGTLPSAPDVDYQYDNDTGTLLLYRNGEVLFDGQAGADGQFHDVGGRVFGRRVDGSLVLDPDALPGNAAPDNATDDSAAGAEAGVHTDTDRDEPKLCPDPSTDRPGGKSERSKIYQQQISGLPSGLGVELGGVMFDGCRESDGTMLEAKGLGYAWAMKRPDEWEDFYTGVSKIMDQAEKQSNAASDRRIEWHFAEEPVANYFREKFEEQGFSNITVIYTPYLGNARP
jgi:hypothetical protein